MMMPWKEIRNMQRSAHDGKLPGNPSLATCHSISPRMQNTHRDEIERRHPGLLPGFVSQLCGE